MSAALLIIIVGKVFIGKAELGNVQNISANMPSIAKTEDSKTLSYDKAVKTQILDAIKKNKEDEKAIPINQKNQEQIYLYVKDRINIKKEDAKNIFISKML